MRATLLLTVLVANVVWFGLGFDLFTRRARRAVRLLVPRSAEAESTTRTLVASLPFLGGMNAAFAVLSGTCLVSCIFASAAPPSWHVFAATSVAHGTQWACNVPHARRGGRSGGAPWDVLRGPMLLIFVIDGACALSNAIAAAF